MAAGELVALSSIKVVSSAFAFLLVLLALRAWRKQGDPRMRRLTLGFSLLLLSLVAEGVVFQFLDPGNLVFAHLVEASTQLASLAVFVWALF